MGVILARLDERVNLRDSDDTRHHIAFEQDKIPTAQLGNDLPASGPTESVV